MTRQTYISVFYLILQIRNEIHSESVRTISIHSDIYIRANANHSKPIRKTFCTLNFHLFCRLVILRRTAYLFCVYGGSDIPSTNH